MYKKSVFTKRRRKKHGLGEFATLGFEMTLQLDYSKGAPTSYFALFDWFLDNCSEDFDLMVEPVSYEGQPAEVRVQVSHDMAWEQYSSLTPSLKSMFLDQLSTVPFLTVKEVSQTFDCAHLMLRDGKLQIEQLDPAEPIFVQMPDLYKGCLRDQKIYLQYMQEKGLDPLAFIYP